VFEHIVAAYIISHLAAIGFVLAAWRWPRMARGVAGIGFLLAGGFNMWTAMRTPEVYVQGFGPHALPPFRDFIYGPFSRHITAIVAGIVGAQTAIGVLAFAPPPWRKLSFLGAIIFLVAITGLGVGSTAPATLVFAAGMLLLLLERSPR